MASDDKLLEGNEKLPYTGGTDGTGRGCRIEVSQSCRDESYTGSVSKLIAVDGISSMNTLEASSGSSDQSLSRDQATKGSDKWLDGCSRRQLQYYMLRRKLAARIPLLSGDKRLMWG